jgi:hypothetical protein
MIVFQSFASLLNDCLKFVLFVYFKKFEKLWLLSADLRAKKFLLHDQQA